MKQEQVIFIKKDEVNDLECKIVYSPLTEFYLSKYEDNEELFNRNQTLLYELNKLILGKTYKQANTILKENVAYLKDKYNFDFHVRHKKDCSLDLCFGRISVKYNIFMRIKEIETVEGFIYKNQ